MGNIARSSRRSDVYYDPSTPEEDIAAMTPGNESAEEDDESEETEEEESSEETEVVEETKDITEAADTVAVQTKPVEELPKGSAPVFKTSGLPAISKELAIGSSGPACRRASIHPITAQTTIRMTIRREDIG